MISPYQTALNEGYTEKEIQEYFQKKIPDFEKKYSEAINEGYSPEEIYSYLSKPEKKSALQTASDVSENINRQLLRSGSRIAENVLGAPRALGEFLESIIPEQALIKGAEKVGLGEGAKTLLETTKKFAPYKLLPTSEDVRSASEFLFGKAVKPKNEWEAKADEVIEDFTNLAIPLPGNKLKVIKPAVLALGGNVASNVIGKMGGTEKEQTAVKLGTYFLGSLINPKSAENLKNDLFSKARNARPERVRVSSPQLDKNLNSLERNLKKGGSEPWKDKIFKKIEEIRKNISGNSIEVGELEKFKTSINNIISELYAEKNISKPGIKTAGRFVKKLGKAVDKSLDDYGKVNKEWEAFYRPANEVHGAIQESKKARNFIERLGKKYGHHLILPLLGISHFAGPASTASGLLIGGTLGAGALTGGEIIAKVWKSPTLRKLYLKLIESATKQNVLATKQNLDKLEKEAKKEKLI